MKEDVKTPFWFYLLGIIPVIWIGLLIAPYIDKGLFNIIKDFSEITGSPFKIIICDNSLKTVIVLILIYFLAIFFYITTKKNYRRGEEYGSAKWGNKKKVNKKLLFIRNNVSNIKKIKKYNQSPLNSGTKNRKKNVVHEKPTFTCLTSSMELTKRTFIISFTPIL